MFKVGDEVLVKATVVKVDGVPNIYPYLLSPRDREIKLWMSEEGMIPADKTYTQGLADAWELAKKIYDTTHADRNKIFGMDNSCNGIKNVFDMFKPEEALAKISEYEKKKEIKVGDVVKHTTESIEGVVTMVTDVDAYITWIDGSCGHRELEYLIKTGKHIDIESLLRQIGE